MRCAGELGVKVTMSGDPLKLGYTWCADCAATWQAKDNLLLIIAGAVYANARVRGSDMVAATIEAAIEQAYTSVPKTEEK
jgi:hypothetical protein